jgi:glucose/arabinose dehydrogenase
MRLLPAALALLAAVSASATPSQGTGRDPFESYTTGTVIDPRLPILQRTPIDAMKLQGVASNTASPRALLLLPDGSTHVVKVGDAVGPLLGRITAIRPGQVVIVEKSLDVLGHSHTTKTVLTTR